MYSTERETCVYVMKGTVINCMAAVALPCVCGLYCTRKLFPRQAHLAAGMVALGVAINGWSMGSQSMPQSWGTLGFLFLNCLEMPIHYYIMLRDSRYWAEMDVANQFHDFDTPLLNSAILSELGDLHTAAKHTALDNQAARPARIPFTEIEIESRPFAAGGEGSVFKCTWLKKAVAAKRFVCFELTRVTLIITLRLPTRRIWHACICLVLLSILTFCLTGSKHCKSMQIIGMIDLWGRRRCHLCVQRCFTFQRCTVSLLWTYTAL